ncbi:transporter substrate-binding domain-containing protein [Shewanella cyperi]|uniref:Transporter substrate-binding domain-containing protein n=1 Tax=Shewanella cyperi TaxID=2814292 RepID=A0A974XJV2_9GAMM|nr:transporter substrate-binding domain-containing protein [Shewanella cyperi]QSX29639.1 transporter substrate-binding domain-containing protein [Shewanella cyperi]
MQSFLLRCISLLMAVLLQMHCAMAEADLARLNYLTEDYPPFNYSEDGQLKGISVDMLIAAAAKSGYIITPGQIKIMPWTRAYHQAMQGPDTVLFSTVRTPEREELFNWVGPISPVRVVLLARKKDAIVINQPGELAQYSIGVMRDAIGEVLLKSMGMESNLYRITNTASMVRMLQRGRVELWAYEDTVARWFTRREGLNFDDFEVVYLLQQSELYYAFSKDVPQPLLQSLQSGLDALKQTDDLGHSEWQNIRDLYLQQPPQESTSQK